ncbi:MAG: acylneuraminate cytidylyltransferase family protein [Candidatus Cloacimonetes bacterium]|nr:acylneuraminate cytidylyltransferase family protein [Candidatus Cloacimonadota bacterium]
MSVPFVKALVPMKHHSERVQAKNFRKIGGKPLFYWILESLSKSKYIDEIIINTDSDLIAEDATKNFNVTILKRPDFLLGDMVSMAPLTKYDLSKTDGDFYLQTHSTNPLLKTSTINKAIETYFLLKQHDSLFTVTLLKTRFYWPDGRAINHDPDNLIRTQDLPPIYEENSCIYIFSREIFNSHGHRIGKNPYMMPIDRIEAIDIDNEEDFLMADFFLNLRQRQNKNG